jgi:hypothetical protein
MLNLNMRWNMINFHMLLMFIYHLCDAFIIMLMTLIENHHTHMCLVEYDRCFRVK